MAGFFSEDFIEEVRARNDIVDVVSGYVRLTKKGRNYWGICPFHHEKTPSFSVSPDKEMYYCFGCHEGGSVFKFIQQMERCEFPEAVRILAERAGLEIPETKGPGENRRDALYGACREAAMFFHEQLYQPDGRAALEYLTKRGLDERMIRRFGLGWAPAQGDALVRRLESKGFTREQMRQACLAGENAKGCYDFFRGRVMFPVIDRKNRVVAFGGRVMDKSQPKYINTPETVIFKKRENLYGINLVHRLRRVEKMFLVEGYMDVVSLHMAGVDFAVASLGTALTVEQARLIKRYCGSVYLGYDGDSAGQNAMHRGGDILRAEGLETRIVTFPDGMDPDDFARAKGLAGVNDLLDAALPLNDYFITALGAQYDLESTDGRAKYVSRCCTDVLSKIVSPVERDGYITQLARRTGISATAIAEELSRMGAATPPPTPVEAPAPTAKAGQGAPAQPVDRAAVAAEETVLRMALQSPRFREQLKRDARPEDFTAPALRELAELLLGDRQSLTPAALAETAGAETCSEVSRLLVSQDDAAQSPQLFEDCIRELQIRRIESRISAINDELRTNGANDARRSDLKRQQKDLLAQKAALNRTRGT
ncbi:MAG: DNA primase [Eubacteriales bacterium]|nr:DNA primase [Eubacteriales bacterium]